jgi:two-component system phosphate regulon sensor histidine kinase PhoR
MSLLSDQDVSLYKLALSIEPALQILSVSPATLKSLVESFVDLLIEQKITSEIWIKSPFGNVWSAEIADSHNQAGIPHTIYTCRTAESEEDKEKQGTEISPLFLPSRVIPVQLASSAQLRREYFFLVLSDQFWGLILAQRPRHSQEAVATTPERHLLLAICTFNRRVVQRVFQDICRCLRDQREVGRWSNQVLKENSGSLSLSPGLLTQLLVKQVQRQEEIWRRGESNRASALARVTLQQQKEVLLNNLQLKDELLEHVAQELRMPLTNMKTAMTLLEAAQLKPAQRLRYMHLLHRECDRQSSLISRLLEMVQLERVGEATDKHVVQLADIIPGVVSTYQAIAGEKGIQLGYTVSPTLPTVSCFEAGLRQIIIHLLNNSIKFTPTGGQVWVRTKQQGEYVQMEIGDTGIGIAPHELPKIFDRFYRGRPAPGEDSVGVGLGLTIVQQLLLHCGGSISVTSRLGEGSTFKVLLPIEISMTN